MDEWTIIEEQRCFYVKHNIEHEYIYGVSARNAKGKGTNVKKDCFFLVFKDKDYNSLKCHGRKKDLPETFKILFKLMYQ